MVTFSTGHLPTPFGDCLSGLVLGARGEEGREATDRHDEAEPHGLLVGHEAVDLAGDDDAVEAVEHESVGEADGEQPHHLGPDPNGGEGGWEMRVKI